MAAMELAGKAAGSPAMPRRITLMRDREGSGEQPVGFIELFFDLVFVFAITQLAHRIIDHLTPIGMIETVILLLAVWWLWIGTSWAMNWLSPERALVRLMLFVLMGLGLLLSAAVPDAFGEDAMIFAVCYVVAQVGRSLVVLGALHHAREPETFANFVRLTLWSVLASPLWIGGAMAEGGARIAIWGIAIAVEYTAQALNYRLPGQAAAHVRDWDVAGDHLAERCALFIILAMGETIIVTGATYAEGEPTIERIAALAIAVAGSAAMWWIYFDVGAKRAAKKMVEADDPGFLARQAYSFLHVPIIAGIILVAVADEKSLIDPLGDAKFAFRSVAAGGAALFLLGVMLFKRSTAANHRLPVSHLVGVILLAVLWLTGGPLPALVFNACIVGALITVSMLERVLRSEPTAHAHDAEIVIEVEG